MMRLVTVSTALQNAVRRVPRSGKGYTSNFFASAEDIERWVASRSIFLMEQEQALLIVRRDGKFQRLYHVATSTAALAAALSCLEPASPAVATITDLVGEPENIDGPVNAHAQNGFATYTRLLRMTRLFQSAGLEDIQTHTEAELAAPDDVHDIKRFLDKQLDPVSEQIPSVDQLQDAVSRNAVLVVRQASTVGGVLIYDATGFTTILRYWHVGKNFRHQGIGSRLIRTFFSICRASKRILLWVIEGNENAIAKYRYYGFRVDSLVDNIMVRRGEGM